MKIILAYSGGLDTSVALHWLQHQYSADVVAFVADIGQVEPMFEVHERAVATGACEVRVEDLTDRFLSKFALPALQAHARYEEKYLLAAPLSRPLIAERLVTLAEELGADAVAHGGSGKGNDLIRFHTSIAALNPELRVIAPLVEWDMKTRAEEVEYARAHNIQLPTADASPYSVDTNIWGTSIECGVLDDITQGAPSDAWQLTRSAKPEIAPTRVRIGFRHGVPVSIDGAEMAFSDIVRHLNVLGAAHLLGRIDIIEGRLIGFKSRGIYEAPAASILMMAHGELESVVLDRETLHHKQGITGRYGELVYYGYWFSDLRRALDGYVQVLQERLSGEIEVEMYNGTLVPISRQSPSSRYSEILATYGAGDTFRHYSSLGFSYVWSLPLT